MKTGETFNVPTTSSGFAHGVGLFETCAIVDRRVAFFDEHWARLIASAKALGLPFDEDKAGTMRSLRAFLDATAHPDSTALKLILFEESPGKTRLVWNLRNKRVLAPEVSQRLIISPQRIDESAELCGHKTLNYWANRRGLERAGELGAADAIVLNSQGRVAECWAANLFLVIGTTLYTPPTGDGPLPGIVREVLIREAAKSSLTIVEKSFTVADIFASDGVFMTNSLIGVQAIIQISLQRGTQWNAEISAHPMIEKAKELYAAACAKSLLSFPSSRKDEAL